MASPGASTPPSSSVDNLEEGDKVVALRILPGVDVLEHRWAAAEKIFEENGIEAVDYFTGADPTEIKKIITDELGKGDVQGIWMDAGDGAVAAIEAFEDAGADYPVMTGEDEMSFLRKWEETGLTGLAPVYSNFQWRTPLLALEKIFAGEEVPAEWVLPADADHRGRARRLPGGQRRACPTGTTPSSVARTSPGYPEAWQDRRSPDRRPGRVGSTSPLARPTAPGPLATSNAPEGHRSCATDRHQHVGLDLAAHRRDASPTCCDHVADLGFDAVELPLENARRPDRPTCRTGARATPA